MIIHIHCEELESTLQVKSVVLFSTVVRQYYRNIGLYSGDFYYKDALIIDHDKTLSQLGLINEARLIIRNARAVDTSKRPTLKVSIYRVENNTPTKFVTRFYSVKPGTQCKALVDTLRSDLCISTLILVFNARNRDDLEPMRPEDDVNALGCVRAFIMA